MPVSPSFSDGDPHQRADHVIEPLTEDLGHRPDVAERLGHLQARACLTCRSKCRSIACSTHATDRTAALAEVEHHAACRPSDLPTEVGIAPIDGFQIAA